MMGRFIFEEFEDRQEIMFCCGLCDHEAPFVNWYAWTFKKSRQRLEHWRDEIIRHMEVVHGIPAARDGRRSPLGQR